MKLKVNEKVINFQGSTISDLLESQNSPPNSGIVVAVNKSIVLKSQWHCFKLQASDTVIVVLPAEGG